MYKTICAECGKIIYRLYKLTYAICDGCKVVKYYKYKKQNYKDSFIDRNVNIYIEKKSGVSTTILVNKYNLSRVRICKIIKMVEGKKENDRYKIAFVKTTSKVS